VILEFISRYNDIQLYALEQNEQHSEIYTVYSIRVGQIDE